MSEKQKNIIDYIVVCVNEFARENNMSNPAALSYLHEFKGLDFLEEEYDIEHTQSIDDTLEHLMIVCRRQGGMLA